MITLVAWRWGSPAGLFKVYTWYPKQASINGGFSTKSLHKKRTKSLHKKTVVSPKYPFKNNCLEFRGITLPSGNRDYFINHEMTVPLKQPGFNGK